MSEHNETLPLRVVLVEDDKRTAQCLAELLSTQGYNVTVCRSLRDGVAAVTDSCPDICVVDYGAGNTNAMAFCEEIRRLYQGAGPVIVATATDGEANSVNELLDAGADDCLCRPFSADMFVARMQVAAKRVQRRDHSNRLKVQLRHARKMESLGILAAGVAHEINTPSQYIGDNIAFLKDSFGSMNEIFELVEQMSARFRDGMPVEELAQQIAETINGDDFDFLRSEIPNAILQSQEGVDRVSAISRAMKSFCYHGPEEKVPIDINGCIDSTLTVSRNEWKYVATVNTSLDPELPPVLCYPGELNQVVLNLVVNAAHAIGELSESDRAVKGTIDIETRCEDEQVIISVRDTGVGVSTDIAEKILEPFFTTKALGQGSGQGLSLTRTIVEDHHGGSLSFSSPDGGGAMFEVRLPIALRVHAEELSEAPLELLLRSVA